MQIIDKPLLKKYTTLGLGGTAQKEYILESFDDVEKVACFLNEDKLPHILLGGGSNVLIEDAEINAVLVRDLINSKEAVKVVKEDSEFVWIAVSSGVYLPLFIQFCAKNGFSGLEGLAGIPGRMGGALAMNAGAFGCSVVDVFDSATIFTPEYGIQKYYRNDLEFAYRHFSLKKENSYTINMNMTFKMLKKSSQEVQDTIRANFEKKKSSQPLREKTAGCAFKNPEGYAAGKLIQDVGLKGFKINDMGFSSIHANFLTNFANGRYVDAIELIELAQEKVMKEFNIYLQTEIKIINNNKL